MSIVMSIRQNYRHTLYASYLGYITQAIVNNLAPLLFLTFQKEFELSLGQIASLVSVNFGVQLIVDFLAAKFIDKIGYRISIVGAHIFAFVGLICLGWLPSLFSVPYWGLLLAVIIYAVGGGIIEVLISPIVEACPTEEKSASMSLLHSFYCWGHVAVVILSTVFFKTAGIENWKLLTALWSLVPLLNAFYFTKVPILKLVEEDQGIPVKKLFSSNLFWVMVLLMICAGASEQAMSQWASAFAESGLNISKTLGDLAGPCLFAVLMGSSRMFYAAYSTKIKLQNFIIGSSILCIFSYLLAVFAPFPILSLAGCALCGLSVGILWPGTFSIAAKYLKNGGTAMFAFFALAGDLGCSSGPWLVGTVSEFFDNQLKTGLLAAIGFPILMILGTLLLKRCTSAHRKNCNGSYQFK